MLLSIYDNYISSGSYDDNLSTFGVVSLDAPSAINIYTDSFEDKDAVSGCIESYNQSVKKADQITYTDYAELLMSSVTTIINIISYVLIAFVAVSLLVSSIMIGIITLYLCFRANERNRHSAGYRRVKTKYYAGVQSRDLYCRTLFWRHRDRYFTLTVDSW